MFAPIDTTLFFTKNDPLDNRLGDFARTYDPSSASKNSLCLIGYPDDEGVRLNGGRPGAAAAPLNIRKALYKMTPPPEYQKPSPFVFDVGDLVLDGSLNERQAAALNMVSSLKAFDARIISLGGGHDYGFVDGSAFCEKYISTNSELNKPLLINFDAHLDVRPNTLSNHSGTPFFRLKEKYKNNFNLVEIGLQSQCNSKTHWQWAQDRDIDLISLESIEDTNWQAVWKNKYIADLTAQTPVYISFDIDSLRTADAGGCSQAWPTGLKISECLKFLKKLYSIANPRGLGIYEVAPCFDVDFKTSKAAALLAHQFIYS